VLFFLLLLSSSFFFLLLSSSFFFSSSSSCVLGSVFCHLSLTVAVALSWAVPFPCWLLCSSSLDIGQLVDGKLQIVDRKKNIFKVSGGRPYRSLDLCFPYACKLSLSLGTSCVHYDLLTGCVSLSLLSLSLLSLFSLSLSLALVGILQLAQGEYVAAEKLESVYSKNLFVEQIFVYGDSLQPSVVGIVVPNAEYFLPHLQSLDLAGAEVEAGSAELEALYQDPKVRALILNELLRTAKEQKLRGFEFLRSVALSSELFSVENGLLTPTFKNKRPVLKKRFADAIQQLYDEYWNYNTLHK
jgi:hypothetical protein